MRATRVYVVCPRFLTGGTVGLHKLCDYLSTIGADASIYYLPNPDADYSVLYPEFGNIRVSTHIEDAPGTVVIIPEIARILEFREAYPNSVIAMYWLSFNNAALLGMLKENLEAESQAIHLFQSYYEYAMVRPFLSWRTWWYFLTDHIDSDFMALESESFIDGKQDIVCYNGNKDVVTPNVCESRGIPSIGIAGMSREQVNETLRTCKVYVDFGYHPGKDRMPREAAMHGCVVVTNKSGSAAYWEDVPIEEKVTLERDLHDLIPDIFVNYRHYFDKQAHYREVIRSEEKVFAINVKNFWGAISAELPPPGGFQKP